MWTAGGAVASRAAVRARASAVTQRKELHKNFDVAREEQLYAWWEEQGFFSPDHPANAQRAAGDPFVVPMPPPNVTGRLHMGHAMFATFQDIMVRFQRMRGRPTLWLPGTDHAGIATQVCCGAVAPHWRPCLLSRAAGISRKGVCFCARAREQGAGGSPQQGPAGAG